FMANSLRKKTPPPPPVPSADELAPDKEVEVTVQEVVKDERTRRIAGSASLLFTFFIFFALTSYIFSWQEDFDKVQQFGLAIFDNADIRVNNLLGAIGAYVAHNLIFNGFGLASYAICAFFFALSINLLFGKRIFNLLRNIKYVVVGLLVISTTLSFFTVNEAFSWGGATGEMLQGWLTKWIGRVGTGALLFTVYFAYYIWRFNPSFHWFDFSKWLAPKKEAEIAEQPIANSWLVEDESLLIKEQTHEEEIAATLKPLTPLSGNKLKEGTAPLNLQLTIEEEQPENPLNQFDLVEKAIELQPEPEINWEEEKTLMQDLPVAITPPVSAVTSTTVGSPIFEVNSPITENTDNPIFSLHQQSQPEGKLYIDEKVVSTPKPAVAEKTPAFEVTVPVAENEHQAETVSNLQAEKNL
ncbi:MAG: DNA translocase FtsK 4TM domain-containing protein, partial [Chitinophagaceae bacterium]